METKKCQHCGTANNAQFQFCNICGKPLQEEEMLLSSPIELEQSSPLTELAETPEVDEASFIRR